MNMELAFYTFGTFFLCVTSICLISLYFSESLEEKARRVFRKRSNPE